MSRLLEVATTAPGAARILGTTQLVVLPVRGPATMTLTSSHEENRRGLPARRSRPIGSPTAPPASTRSRSAFSRAASSPRASRSRRDAPDRAASSPRRRRGRAPGWRLRHARRATAAATVIRAAAAKAVPTAHHRTAPGTLPRASPTATSMGWTGTRCPLTAEWSRAPADRHAAATAAPTRQAHRARASVSIRSHTPRITGPPRPRR